MKKLPNHLKLYIGVLCMFATILLAHTIINYEYDLKIIIFFGILAIIAESLAVPLPNSGAVSVGFAIGLASIIIGGPLNAAAVTAIGFIFRVPMVPGRGYVHVFNTPFYQTLFNVSQSIIITILSALAYVYVGGTIGVDNFNLSILIILLTLLVDLILNTVIMARLMSLLSGEKFIRMWLNNIRGVLPSAAAVGTLGVIIALAYISYGPVAVLLFFGPLLLARYSFKLYMDMRHVYMETIKALTNAMEAKDSYTNGHASRVGEYAVKLAQALKLPDKKIENIKVAALLHDIGKIGVDDSILRKPGKLTEIEYAAIQQHPTIGAHILKDVDFLKDVLGIIKYHHERYDGNGYPEGIKGDLIPQEAAILSIADVYDAMTSDRPYRKALTPEEALAEIGKNAGTQFEPHLANSFVALINKEIKKEVLLNVN